MICKKCGTKNIDGMKFCKNCGAELHADNYDMYDNNDANVEISKSKSPKWIVISIIIVFLAIFALVVFLIVSQFYNDKPDKNDDIGTAVASNVETTLAEQESVDDISITYLETTVIQISVPNVIGMKSSDAYDKITDLGLKYKSEFEYSNNIPEDYVISQSPISDSSARINDTVTIYISRGSQTSNVISSSANSALNSDYILPDSNKRYISKSDISSLSAQNMEIALNEIYARHGRKFSSSDLSNYFNSKSWYSGTIDASKFNDNVFNDYERKNIDLIVSVMEEKGYR